MEIRGINVWDWIELWEGIGWGFAALLAIIRLLFFVDNEKVMRAETAMWIWPAILTGVIAIHDFQERRWTKKRSEKGEGEKLLSLNPLLKESFQIPYIRQMSAKVNRY